MLATAVVAAACGGEAVDNTADGPQETVAGEASLSDLSRDQKLSVCQELAELLDQDTRAVVCRHNGISAIGEQLPSTDDLARGVCEEAYQDCLDADPCAELPVFSKDCPVDVAQYRRCAAEDLESRFQAYQELPLCSEATKDAPSMYFRVAATYPDICWPIVPCYDGVESGTD